MTQTQQTALLPAFMDYERLSANSSVVMKQFRNQKTVHAYLLTGARGLGKRTFAKVLASALFCTSENKPCGTCYECKQFFEGNNPDLLTIFADDGKQIGVDRVRDMIAKTSQHAFGSGYRVVLIEPVEKMTHQAQNCLLKSLEEPVANVVYLLMTHELTATLGTIASRCVRVKLSPWPDEILGNTLMKLGYSDQQIVPVLRRCGGNVGTALEMLDENAAGSEVQTFVNAAFSMTNDAACVGVSTKLKESREGADQYLNALEQAIHQALMVRCGMLDPDALANYPSVWQKASVSAPIEDFTELLTMVFDTRKRKAGQVNWQSNIDHLMLRLLEEQIKWQQSLA